MIVDYDVSEADSNLDKAIDKYNAAFELSKAVTWLLQFESKNRINKKKQKV